MEDYEKNQEALSVLRELTEGHEKCSHPCDEFHDAENGKYRYRYAGPCGEGNEVEDYVEGLTVCHMVAMHLHIFALKEGMHEMHRTIRVRSYEDKSLRNRVFTEFWFKHEEAFKVGCMLGAVNTAIKTGREIGDKMSEGSSFNAIFGILGAKDPDELTDICESLGKAFEDRNKSIQLELPKDPLVRTMLKAVLRKLISTDVDGEPRLRKRKQAAKALLDIMEREDWNNPEIHDLLTIFKTEEEE